MGQHGHWQNVGINTMNIRDKMNPHPLTASDVAELIQLEEAMWRASTRFDIAFQEKRFAADFVEFGRSGKTYTRDQMILASGPPIDAELPLDNLTVRALAEGVVQVTYNSHVLHDGVLEHGRRSSIWTRSAEGWVMRFHQGTPYEPDIADALR